MTLATASASPAPAPIDPSSGRGRGAAGETGKDADAGSSFGAILEEAASGQGADRTVADERDVSRHKELADDHALGFPHEPSAHEAVTMTIASELVSLQSIETLLQSFLSNPVSEPATTSTKPVTAPASPPPLVQANSVTADAAPPPSDPDLASVDIASLATSRIGALPLRAASPQIVAQDLKSASNLTIISRETHFAPVDDSTVLALSAAGPTPPKPTTAGREPDRAAASADLAIASDADTDATALDVALQAAAASSDGRFSEGSAGQSGSQSSGRGATRSDRALAEISTAVSTDRVAPQPTEIANLDYVATDTSRTSTAFTPPSISKQIATGVASQLPAPDTAAPTSAAPNTIYARPVLTKILTIELQPSDLGTVTIRLEWKADQLELEIEASHRDTADLIRRDRETLANVLKQAGYNIADAAIQVTEQDRPLVASSQSLDDRAGAGAGERGPDGRTEGRASGEHGQSRERSPERRGGVQVSPDGISIQAPVWPSRSQATGVYV